MQNHLETTLHFLIFQSAAHRELPQQSHWYELRGKWWMLQKVLSESHTACLCLQDLLRLVSYMQLPLDEVVLCIPSFMA